jgi:cellulose synthase (UDP-forming)
MRARLPLRVRLQYLLSCSYFLTGWTVLAYMTFPVVRILTGAQPLAAPAADQFLLHFAPYFGMALSMVAMMGAGGYTFRAFALQSASFWIHVHASLKALLRRPGSFKVTPKRGADGRQPRAMLPALAAAGVLLTVAVAGLLRHHDPSTMNNAAFALVHLTVLSFGVAPALRAVRRPVAAAERDRTEGLKAA